MLTSLPGPEVRGLVTPIVPVLDARADFQRARHAHADFRPTTTRISYRWQRIALAHRRGQALPPIAVSECPDGYYVIDGRHRVSVARALGLTDIEAWVSSNRTARHPRSRPLPTTATASA